MALRDPVSADRRFAGILRLAALLSLALAAIAVALVVKGYTASIIYPVLALALAAGLCVLLGSALMSLRFIGNGQGQGAGAADEQDKDGHDPGT